MSKVARSLSTAGSSKASTMAIFCPKPQRVELPQLPANEHFSLSKPYACRICEGVRPTGVEELKRLSVWIVELKRRLGSIWTEDRRLGRPDEPEADTSVTVKPDSKVNNNIAVREKNLSKGGQPQP